MSYGVKSKGACGAGACEDGGEGRSLGKKGGAKSMGKGSQSCGERDGDMEMKRGASRWMGHQSGS